MIFIDYSKEPESISFFRAFCKIAEFENSRLLVFLTTRTSSGSFSFSWSWSSLQTLNISNNTFQIPALSLSNISSSVLKELSLSQSGLNGVLPGDMPGFSRLEALDLAHNSITGE